MGSILGYMGASLDGYVADREGGVGWMERFTADTGYGEFIASVGTVVIGRVTYDQVLTFPGGWPYSGKRGIVVSSRPLADPPPGVALWNRGVPALVAELRQARDDAWMVGGAALQGAFIAAGAIDRLDLFVLPILLGDGVRTFPASPDVHDLRLLSADTFGQGIVRLRYGFGAG